MRILVDSVGSEPPRDIEVDSGGVLIGRSPECAVRLESRLVSARHASLERHEDGWRLTVLGAGATVEVGDRVLGTGARVVVSGRVVVRVLPYVLTLDEGPPGPGEEPRVDLAGLVRECHVRVLTRLRSMARSDETAGRRAVRRIVDELASGELRGRILDDEAALREITLRELDRRVGAARAEARGQARREPIEPDPQVEADAAAAVAGSLAGEVARLVEFVRAATSRTIRYLVVEHIAKIVGDLVFGFGPLQDLLDDPRVTDVMVVSRAEIYVEREGRKERIDREFESDEALVSVIERIAAPVGRRIDRSRPIVDARLPDGSRLNAVIPPLAIKGPCLTIRRFSGPPMTPEDLVSRGVLDGSVLAFLRAAVLSRRNIAIVGGTGSGKTTMLNVLAGLAPASHRIVTIEDAAELRLPQPHVVALETKPPNAEGAGAYTIRDLLRNALRMYPDRIIVGECRGAEALDMLQAMNTGHSGSMTTLHANTATDAVARIEAMALEAASLHPAALRRQIAGALDLIVVLGRVDEPGGPRRMVTEVAEVGGVDPDSGEVRVATLYQLWRDDAGPRLRPTGTLPSFVDDLVRVGGLDPRAFLEGARP